MSSTSNHDIQALIDHKVKTGITNGGRALNAVWESDLKQPQKSILLYLGSKADFRGSFMDAMEIKQSVLAKKCSMKKRSIITHLLELEKNKYITSIQKPGYENTYSLTSKIFDEHEVRLKKYWEEYYGIKPGSEKFAQPPMKNLHNPHENFAQPPMKNLHDPCEKFAHQYSLPQSFPSYSPEPRPKNDPLIINDILNLESYPSIKLWFEALDIDRKEKMTLVLKDNSNAYDYNSMSQEDLEALLSQVLKEIEKGVSHAINPKYRKQVNTKGRDSSCPPMPDSLRLLALNAPRHVPAQRTRLLDKCINGVFYREKADSSYHTAELNRLLEKYGYPFCHIMFSKLGEHNERKELKVGAKGQGVKMNLTELLNSNQMRLWLDQPSQKSIKEYFINKGVEIDLPNATI